MGLGLFCCLLFGLVFCVFVCKISYIIFARTEVRLTSRWFSRFSFSFLMTAFFLILRQLGITILDLLQMIENGPAVRSTCSFSILRCHLSDAMELHMSKWFKRSLTQSVCPACKVSLSQTLPLGSGMGHPITKKLKKPLSILAFAMLSTGSALFSDFFFYIYISLRCLSCCYCCFVLTCTPGLCENLLTCSGNVIQAYSSVFLRTASQPV